MTALRGVALLLALAGCEGPASPAAPAPPPPPRGPDFSGLSWVDAAPEVAGKVALVRWWTNG
jgi:hypothetical protein